MHCILDLIFFLPVILLLSLVVYVVVQLVFILTKVAANWVYGFFPFTRRCGNCGRASIQYVYCPSCNYATLSDDE